MARQQQNMMLWVVLGLGALWVFSQPRRPAARIPVAAPSDIYSAAPDVYSEEAYRAQRAGEREPVDIWVPTEAALPAPPAEEAVVWPTEGPRIPGYPEPSIIVESPFAAHGYRWW